MKFDEDLAVVHAYLCADGYVIKNPRTQKHKYYHIGLRNTNDVLLKDFQEKFNKVFGIKPVIAHERCIAHSREIFEKLTKNYSYYSYEWQMPKLNKKQLRLWLRAFFDCEGWVELQEGKNRAIRVDCVNLKGIKSVKIALNRLGIDSAIKKGKRPIYRLNICGLDDIARFKEIVGFLHPDKKSLLDRAINSYKTYEWNVPKEKKALVKFIKTKGKMRESRNEIRLLSIKKENLEQVIFNLLEYDIRTRILGPWKASSGSVYYCLILKVDDVRKLEE